MKRARILTNRNFPDGRSVEYIEKDECGQFYWRAVDYSLLEDFEHVAECCFPVDLQFVKEKFIECDRVYKKQ